jgi:hypothetical protein
MVFDEIIDSIYVYMQIELIKRFRDICYPKVPIVVINTGNYVIEETNNEIDNNVIKSLSIYFMEADLKGTRIRLNLR